MTNMELWEGPSDKYYEEVDGQVLHRPPWKVCINKVLRWIQPFTDKKFVIYSKTITIDRPDGTRKHVCGGYWIGRVKHIYTFTHDGEFIGEDL